MHAQVHIEAALASIRVTAEWRYLHSLYMKICNNFPRKDGQPAHYYQVLSEPILEERGLGKPCIAQASPHAPDPK